MHFWSMKTKYIPWFGVCAECDRMSPHGYSTEALAILLIMPSQRDTPVENIIF